MRLKENSYKYIFIIMYFSGLLVPYLYMLFFKNIKYLFNKKFILNKNSISLFLLFFLVIQLVSTFLSLFYSEYNNSPIRYIAILHNYINYIFILIAIVMLKNKNYQKNFLQATKTLFYVIIFTAIASFLYSFQTKNIISYEGILSIITGISNNYTQVNINSIGFLSGDILPRTRLFAVYSNTSAIVIFIISVIYLSFYIEKYFYKIFLGILTLLALATTGSRIATIAFSIWMLFFLHKNRNSLFITIIFLSFILLLYFQEIILFIENINSAREDSSNTRFYLYIESLRLMYENNYLFGLGLKPKDLTISILPIGSHSTVIGYFVKNGIIGGVIFLFAYLYIYYHFITLLFKSKKYYVHTYLIAGVFTLSIIYLFEDLDSYEFTAFLSGILIYFAFYKKDYNDNFQ